MIVQRQQQETKYYQEKISGYQPSSLKLERRKLNYGPSPEQVISIAKYIRDNMNPQTAKGIMSGEEILRHTETILIKIN